MRPGTAKVRRAWPNGPWVAGRAGELTELQQALGRLQAERSAEVAAADAKVQDLFGKLEEQTRAAQESSRRVQQLDAEYAALVLKSVRLHYGYGFWQWPRFPLELNMLT